MISFLFLFLSIFGNAEDSQEQQIKIVAKSPEWQRLLHYKTKWWGGLRSELEGEGFFLSPEGYKNPESELRADLKAFNNPQLKLGVFKSHPQCAFPLRYAFLKKTLHLSYKDEPCQQLNDYINHFKAESVALVFSSSFPNNPPSMFGHSFLKIKSSNHSDLLDTGISFAANVSDDENPIAFMFFGLTGGYQGVFTVLPYYQKVNEYVNSESRDVGEYELDFNKEETEALLKHIWELQTNSYFKYYFFDKNCSYQMLAALEVSKPNWNLTNWGPHVIPGETIKEVTRIPGAVKKVNFRPSLRKQLMQLYKALDDRERKLFFEIVNLKSPPLPEKPLPPLTLDAVTRYLQYMRQKKHGLTSLQDDIFKKVLAKRSEDTISLDSVQERLKPIDDSSRPDIGHHPYQVGPSYGLVNNSTGFVEFQIKAAFHDLMNDDAGYAPFSEVNFPGFIVRYLPTLQEVNLEKVYGFSTVSLFPLTFIEKVPSWALSVNLVSPKDYGCQLCHAAQLDGLVGLTLDVFSPKTKFYALGGPRFELSDSFSKGYRYGPSGLVAVLTHPLPHYKLKVEGRVTGDLDQTTRSGQYFDYNVNQSYAFSQEFDLRLSYDQIQSALVSSSVTYQEWKLNFNFYFR